MSGDADTIRRERESRHWTNEQRREAWGEHWPAESGKREGDADRAVDALLAENQRLREALETVQGDVYLWRLREIDTDKAMDAIDKSVAVLDMYREASAGDTELEPLEDPTHPNKWGG